MAKPLISFYATAYRQKEFLHGYFSNILSIQDFDKCELVIVRPKTLDEEENEIYEYYGKNSNIKVHTLSHDLGLYGSWNYAVQHCRSDILSNANTDDRRELGCVSVALAEIRNVDILYADYNIATSKYQLDYPFLCEKRSILPEYTIGGMIKYCLCGHAPFWKKRIFDSRGFRSDLDSAADLDFWLRAIRNGAKVKKVNEVLSTYYLNPKGASTNATKEQKRNAIESEIKRQYSEFFRYSGPRVGKLEEIWVNK